MREFAIFKNCTPRTSKKFSKKHAQLLAKLESVQIFKAQTNFDATLNNVARFLRNFMLMFENLLLFVRASRECNWHLHLASLDEFIKYFFVHDLQNYARYAPIYLSEMHQLKTNNTELWNFLEEGNFSVNKSMSAFSAIGADHALEQENRAMKVTGGIVGIGNQQQILNQHYLIALQMNIIIDSFSEHLDLKTMNRRRYKHYQLTGSTNKRLVENSEKIKSVLGSHEVGFIQTDYLYNIITKTVFPDKDAQQFLDHGTEGKILYEEYKRERVQGNKSIWDTLKKRKLVTFNSTNKEAKIKLKDRIVTLKEQTSLMTRLLIAARSRPEIDIKSLFGAYEFSVVPRSMFASDGKMLLGNDKSSVMHEIEKMIERSEESERESRDTEGGVGLDEEVTETVVIFDGMAVLHRIKLGGPIKCCRNLAEAFLDLIMHESVGSKEIRVVFDRYIEDSLKSSTRDKRASDGTTKTPYKIAEDTSLEKITMKKFLANDQTKIELTTFLGNFLVVKFNSLAVRFAVSYSNITKSNINAIDPNLNGHNHEEADTLMILHAIDVGKQNPFRKLLVKSPDTDVFLLLIHHCQELPLDTEFVTGRGEHTRSISVVAANQVLGDERRQALLGFHAFTACDQTSKFSRKSKRACWLKFINSDEAIMTAFSILEGQNFSYDSERGS